MFVFLFLLWTLSLTNKMNSKQSLCYYLSVARLLGTATSSSLHEGCNVPCWNCFVEVFQLNGHFGSSSFWCLQTVLYIIERYFCHKVYPHWSKWGGQNNWNTVQYNTVQFSSLYIPLNEHTVETTTLLMSVQSWSIGLQMPILVEASADKPKALPNLLPSSYHPEKPPLSKPLICLAHWLSGSTLLCAFVCVCVCVCTLRPGLSQLRCRPVTGANAGARGCTGLHAPYCDNTDRPPNTYKHTHWLSQTLWLSFLITLLHFRSKLCVCWIDFTKDSPLVPGGPPSKPATRAC